MPTRLRRGDRIIVRKRALGPSGYRLASPAAAIHRAFTAAPATPHSAAARELAARQAQVQRTVVDRVWGEIGRATGTIVETDGSQLLVDEGPAKGRRIVMIAREMHRKILVRFPRLEPGYLIDVIGLSGPGFLQALIPATAQPAYRADHAPVPPLARGPADRVSGTAVWHEPGEEPPGLTGLAYPALDPQTCCERARANTASAGSRDMGPEKTEPGASAGGTSQPHLVDPHLAGPGCVRLPYLSVGSIVTIRNECTGRSATLPVTSCGAAARLFCDRCVQCVASPRGRIADLTITAFVELGGKLEEGCFNASLTMTS